jgi:hypothetical protein
MLLLRANQRLRCGLTASQLARVHAAPTSTALGVLGAGELTDKVR